MACCPDVSYAALQGKILAACKRALWVRSASGILEIFLDHHLQVVHFVRHGEGFHNVAGKKDYSQYKRWDLEDAHLTEHGWEQVIYM